MRDLYLISKNTKAILTNDTGYYRSKIIDGHGERLSRHRPEQIIDNSCIIYGASLKGRIGTVKDILKSASKLPVIISISVGIYMIPTASTKNSNCVWLAFHHIKDYFTYDNKTYVSFQDGTGLYVNASVDTLDKQFNRTCRVIVQLNRSTLFGGEHWRW